MNIVRIALRRPHAVIVGVVTILLLGAAAMLRTPIDIFPSINIPVVTVVWYYDGMSADETEKRLTTFSEFSESFFVANLRKIESQTTPGLTIQKLYFEPNVNIDLAVAATVSATNSIRAFMPEGTQPPIIMEYSASSVPVLQLALSSSRLTESELYDYGIYRIRQQLAPVAGTLLPPPYGGKIRQVMVDIDPARLAATGLKPIDVANAVNAQNLSLPAGALRLGATQYDVRMNGMLTTVASLNDVPLKRDTDSGAIIRIGDVAQVRDGTAIQQNVVRRDGQRAVLLSILKTGGASTLEVVDRILHDVLPLSRASAPQGLQIDALFDQSVFVKGAIRSVVIEGAIAGLLTTLMILAFLASWRSTLIVALSIPLSILFSIVMLFVTGETLNLMTLGGLALAVGILVDDATVTIENIHRLRHEGASLERAVLDGAAEIAIPTLVSTLTIASVFVSVVFLVGPPRHLFMPMAWAVIYAMLGSYVISRTIVPVMAALLLRGEMRRRVPLRPSRWAALARSINAAFESLREHYLGLLGRLLASRWKIPAAAACALAAAGVIAPFVGSEFFPAVDAGEVRLHVRAVPGARLEVTEQLFDRVEDTIREVVPAEERRLLIDNIGMAFRFTMPFDDGTTVGQNDGQILLSLAPGHRSTEGYVRRLRTLFAERFPEAVFYFQPADIVTRILNFGLAAQIDVRLSGGDAATNRGVMNELEAELVTVPGLVDVHLHQIIDSPQIAVDVDRKRAGDLGLTLEEVARNVMVSLASSSTTTPNFWVDPKSGIQYPVVVQTPTYRLNGFEDLETSPVAGATGSRPAGTLLQNVARLTRGTSQSVISHTNIQPSLDIYANSEGRDLGAIARDVEAIVARHRAHLAPGSTLEVLGQIGSMRSSFVQLSIGLAAASIVVLLLMTINFQSFLDALVVLLGLPGAMVGIVLTLFASGTALSVPSLMGAIMSVGVVSANSILLVTFAKKQRAAGIGATQAAFVAAETRLRPILMTSCAMVIGMLPSAMGVGEGGEQNAPLARAVIGGLIMGTVATLFFVPWLYAKLRRKEGRILGEYTDV